LKAPPIHKRARDSRQSLNPVTRLLYPTARLSVYEGTMIPRTSSFRPLLRGATAAALLALATGLAGCADMSDTMTLAFADPAKYDLYDCKQLEPERKNLATRQAELQGLMAKADTGVAGPVVAELAYRNEYIAVRGQAKLAEEAWQRNKCHASTPSAAVPLNSAPAMPAAPLANAAKGAQPARGAQPPTRSGSAVY
jgi:hypothetical protein